MTEPTPTTPAPHPGPPVAAPLVSAPLPPAADDPERGDVPGWVLVTLMTAGLVLTLWALAGPALARVFTDALGRVTGFGG